MVLWVPRSQSLIVPSDDAEARVVPSGAKDIDRTIRSCPPRVTFFSPVAASHMWTLPFVVPAREASVEPSGENAIPQTASVDPTRMAGKCCDALPCCDIPDSGRPVIRSGREHRSVGRKHHTVDRSRVAFERRNVSPRCGVPDSCCAIVGRGRQWRSIGRERHSIDWIRMSRKRGNANP